MYEQQDANEQQLKPMPSNGSLEEKSQYSQKKLKGAQKDTKSLSPNRRQEDGTDSIKCTSEAVFQLDKNQTVLMKPPPTA